MFASYDLAASTTRASVVELLRAWRVAAERMTQGRPAGDPAAGDLAPPTDTGDALDEYICQVGSAVYAVPPGAARADGSASSRSRERA